MRCSSGNLRRAIRHALQPRRGKVVQDGEGPGAGVAAGPSLRRYLVIAEGTAMQPGAVVQLQVMN